MQSVFIGGPLRVKKIDKVVRERIDNIIKKNYKIIIGDANGTDALVQEYLRENRYRNVIVYHVNEIRNNIGEWPTKRIETDEKRNCYRNFIIKDLEMAKDSTYGYMIWNGKSNGTMNNVLNLLQFKKYVVVYLTTRDLFFTIKNIHDLNGLLRECKDEDLNKINKKINLFHRVESLEQETFNFDE